MRVALVHDWLTGMRGGEKCLDAFCELYPEADLYTLLHVRGSVSRRIEERRIVTSMLQRWPGVSRYYRALLPLMPSAVEMLELEGYDLVLSSSHCVAKGVLTPPETPHVSYVHTPMRYAWDLWPRYFPRSGRIRRFLAAPLLNYLRTWDVASAARVDRFVANSRFVAGRIHKYFRRRATVVHPPVDTEHFRPAGDERRAYLMVTAMVPYKGVELALAAMRSLNRPLRVVGDGPLRKRWMREAGPHAEFTGWVSADELREHYATCRALLLPAVEDFGIAPLEANACGRPVIALGRAGALDTVVPLGAQAGGDAPTGVFFQTPTADALVDAVRRFEAAEDRFSPDELRRHAEQFSTSRFKQRMARVLDETLQIWNNEPARIDELT